MPHKNTSTGHFMVCIRFGFGLWILMPHKNTSTGHFMVCIRFWIWALDFDATKEHINWTLYGLHSILDLGFGF